MRDNRLLVRRSLRCVLLGFRSVPRFRLRRHCPCAAGGSPGAPFVCGGAVVVRAGSWAEIGPRDREIISIRLAITPIARFIWSSLYERVVFRSITDCHEPGPPPATIRSGYRPRKAIIP